MIQLKVNGKKFAFGGNGFKRLIDVLREDLQLTGTKEGCGEGECGACTVLIDGKPVNSCLIPVCQAEGAKVETVESLGNPDQLNVLQSCFMKGGGAQCGICTPGMLMSAWCHISKGGSDKPQDIKTALAGNLCRCTGYQHIVDSVIQAVKERKKGKPFDGAQGKSAPKKKAKAGSR